MSHGPATSQQNVAQQPKPANPASTLVDVSNAVAGALVEGVNWLGQEATRVPIAPEIAAGEPGIPGAALEETTDPKAFREWRPVSNLEAGGDAVSVVGDVAAAARVVGEATEVGGEVMRFTSLSALRRYLGPAGEGSQWHHIVEQTQANLKKFGVEASHSTDNMVKVPTSIHVGKNSISAYYSSSTQPFTEGMTVRKWLSTQSFSAQRRFGIKTLKGFGQWK